MKILQSILKYWAVIALIISLVGSGILYAYAFGVYSSEFQSQLNLAEVKIQMVELKQEVHSKQIGNLEKGEAVQTEINIKIVEKLSEQTDRLTRIENLLLERR